MADIGIYAFLIAESINLKQFRADFPENLITHTAFELFYKDDSRFFYITGYGSVAFAGYDHTEIKEFIKRTLKYSENPLKNEYKEDIIIREDGELLFEDNYVKVGRITPDVIRLTMLNLSQSVALDFYTENALGLLNQTVKYTKLLEKLGKFNISRRLLLRLTGSALGIRNQIIDNLYIFDAPDIVWESENLESLNTILSRAFDLKNRFKELDYTLKIVENNLSIFSNLIHNRISNKLELIIIFLILFEIIYAFIFQH